MAYADYEFYTYEYFGSKIHLSEWGQYVVRACAYIDIITFGRLTHGAVVTDNVRRAVCAVAEEIAAADEIISANTAGVKSENTDGYSVTYVDKAQAIKDRDNAIRAAADLFLPPSDPLRYRGTG